MKTRPWRKKDEGIGEGGVTQLQRMYPAETVGFTLYPAFILMRDEGPPPTLVSDVTERNVYHTRINSQFN